MTTGQEWWHLEWAQVTSKISATRVWREAHHCIATEFQIRWLNWLTIGSHLAKFQARDRIPMSAFLSQQVMSRERKKMGAWTSSRLRELSTYALKIKEAECSIPLLEQVTRVNGSELTEINRIQNTQQVQRKLPAAILRNAFNKP